MAILAASIITRGGKALLSRQFTDINKDRIVELLANFPSLISANTNNIVETALVRYIYHPLEEFYIVLITNKSSNILQDIDTSHLFVSVVSNVLHTINETEIFSNSFEIISAFDEIINLGYKEPLTLSQVSTFLEMDSHEEKIQEIIERNKEMEATEERKRRAKEIQRRELAKKQNADFPLLQQLQDFRPSYTSPVIEKANEPASERNERERSHFKAPRGGLQLGKKKGASAVDSPFSNSNTNTPLFENSNQPLLSNQPQSQSQFQQHSPSPQPSQQSSPAKIQNDGILITVNEKISATLSRDGTILLSEVKGDLQLRINDASKANSKILLKTDNSNKQIQYKTHPNVDKNLFNSSNIIGLKDQSKSFPSNDHALGVLRWRIGKNDNDSSLIPFIITAWVSVDDNSGTATVTLEYELTPDFKRNLLSNNFKNLENISILLPIVSNEVNLTQGDNVRYDITQDGIVFHIESISSDDDSGSFEFTVPAESEDSIFPLLLQFDINNTEATESDVSFGKVQVLDVVTNNDNEESLPFNLHLNISSEGYQVN